LTKVKVAC